MLLFFSFLFIISFRRPPSIPISRIVLVLRTDNIYSYRPVLPVMIVVHAHTHRAHTNIFTPRHESILGTSNSSIAARISRILLLFVVVAVVPTAVVVVVALVDRKNEKKKTKREEKETTVSEEQRSTVFGSGYLLPSKAPIGTVRRRRPSVATTSPGTSNLSIEIYS